MSGFSFGLVSRLLRNRFQFRFQFCLRAASVSGFQFRFKFYQENYFILNTDYLNALLLGVFVFLLLGVFIAMISSCSDGRVKRAIASKVVDLGIISSPLKPNAQKSVPVFTAFPFDAQH